MKQWMCGRRGHRARFLVGIPVWTALIAAVVWMVMALWNWLMPELFLGARPIGYWQALGLLVLCKILFGCGPGRWGRRRQWGPMTPEERDAFKDRFRRRGPDGSTDDSKDAA